MHPGSSLSNIPPVEVRRVGSKVGEQTLSSLIFSPRVIHSMFSLESLDKPGARGAVSQLGHDGTFSELGTRGVV
jgi:hypothetical protein